MGDPTRVGWEKDMKPTDAVQLLVAMPFSLDTATVEIAINRDNDFVSMYHGISPQDNIPREARGILAYEPLFTQLTPGDMGTPEIVEVLSATNNINLTTLIGGDKERAEQLVKNAEDDADRSEELSMLVRSSLRWVGLNRADEIGPQPPGSIAAPKSFGTVALAGKLTVRGAHVPMKTGELVEFYPVGPHEAKQDMHNPEHPDNIHGKMTLRARPYRPASALWRTRKLLVEHRNPKEARPQPNIDDKEHVAAAAMETCITGSWEWGFWYGVHVASQIDLGARVNAKNAAVLRLDGNVPPDFVNAAEALQFLLPPDVEGDGPGREPTLHVLRDALHRVDFWGDLVGGIRDTLEKLSEVWKETMSWVPGRVVRGSDAGEKESWAILIS